MYRNKTAITNFDGETTQTKLIQVTATKINKDENDTLLAVKIAKIIFDSGFTFEEDENLEEEITKLSRYTRSIRALKLAACSSVFLSSNICALTLSSTSSQIVLISCI